MGTFPARVVCPGAGVCLEGGRGLLKLSQPGSCWQAGKYWELVSEAERCWGMFFAENIGRTAVAIFDNLYIKCYNKYNDDN